MLTGPHRTYQLVQACSEMRALSRELTLDRRCTSAKNFLHALIAEGGGAYPDQTRRWLDRLLATDGDGVSPEQLAEYWPDRRAPGRPQVTR
jgi:hypothetical protein